MQFSRLVLPAPLGPMRPRTSRSWTSRLTSSMARTPPNEWTPARPPARRDTTEGMVSDLRPLQTLYAVVGTVRTPSTGRKDEVTIGQGTGRAVGVRAAARTTLATPRSAGTAAPPSATSPPATPAGARTHRTSTSARVAGWLDRPAPPAPARQHRGPGHDGARQRAVRDQVAPRRGGPQARLPRLRQPASGARSPSPS